MLDYPEISGNVAKIAKATLGPKNVIRAHTKPGIDSEGKGALHITIVIAPKAVERIKGDDLLSMLVRINDWLYEIQDERTPIIWYATEKELAAGASPAG